MKRFLLAAAASAAALVAAAPASAVTILPGSANLTFDAFDVSTQGVLVSTPAVNTPGASATIAGDVRFAVYRNTLGTLDFYYQVTKTGGTRDIDGINVGEFDSFQVQGFSSTADLDGATGAFTAANNPGPAMNPNIGSTTTTGRSADGNVLQTDFGLNALALGETSAIYIFRTNATTFGAGFYTVRNSTSFNGVAFAPTGTAVPEPATWGLMLMGFGMVGFGLRARRAARVSFG